MKPNYPLLSGVLLLGAIIAFVYLYRTPAQMPGPVPLLAEFGGVSLSLELATSTEERERGLGGRTSLAEDSGMLFVFDTPKRYGFWMEDTLIPLDIYWLDDTGHVVWMALEVATSTYPTVFYPPVAVRHVLETTAGFARAHGIATGTPLSLPSITL